MLQGLIIKKILDAVMKRILKKYNLDKIKSYVEDDNILDLEVKALKEKIDKLEKIAHTPIDNLQKRLSKLENKTK